MAWEPGYPLADEPVGLPPDVRSVVNERRVEAAGSNGSVVSLTSRIEAGPRPPQNAAARVSVET